MSSLTLEIAGASVTLPQETLAQLWISQLLKPTTAARDDRPMPAIGSAFRGGIFAGVARGRDGQPDYFLVVAEEPSPPTPWDAAMTWAKSLRVGEIADYSLPTRSELALLFANVPELFEKEWHWSCEQYAGYEQSAWCQTFYHGYQYYNLKDSELRARAVRREPIQ